MTIYTMNWKLLNKIVQLRQLMYLDFPIVSFFYFVTRKNF